MSSKQAQRLLVEQLRREAAINRIFVSKAVEEMKKYIAEHEREDYLIIGFDTQRDNPFVKESSCSCDVL